eukprot:Nk52_evm16s250 gene=Nk52_evmTU16s250
MDAEALNKLFIAGGLSEAKAKDTVKSKALCGNFAAVLAEAGVSESKPVGEGTRGALLYNLAAKFPAVVPVEKRSMILKYILSDEIKNDAQLNGALDYVKSNQLESSVEGFKKASGIGIVVTEAQIKSEVNKILEKHKVELVANRYKFPAGKILGEARSVLKWGDGKTIKDSVDAAILAILGPKTEADLAKPAKVKGPKPAKPAAKEKDAKVAAESEYKGAVANFHLPGENHKTDGYVVTTKTMDLLKKHVKVTGGKVWTRFPPEPNGILHIGHSKAMNLNFNYAKKMEGKCYLRFDDTNPETESVEYVNGIKDMAEWLGHKPWKVTYSSDYFDELYALAVELIKRGKAYVCHQTAEQMFEERGGESKGARHESPFRNRPVEENLKLFEDMRKGKFPEGGATLRMKMDMTDGNPQMWDLVAYRVKYSAHHRSGDKWCIYPTYDFTHCLVDSLENISHSLCTREFTQSRISYYWLCNALDVYCPVQWEYSRMNITNTVLSKRKILKLIADGYVRGWTDPRLHTLPALRRRGFPPTAINAFCDKLGITTTDGMVEALLLESCVRDELNLSCDRTMAVLDPIEVVIENYPDGEKELEVENLLSDPSKGTHKVKFSKNILIEKDDFREEAEKGFKRLTPGQGVGLKYIGIVIYVEKVEKNAKGEVTKLVARYEEMTKENKPKGFIHWVSKAHSFAAEVRLYNLLFKSKNPQDKKAVPGGWLSDYNVNSEVIVPKVYLDKYIKKAKVGTVYQFERLGYFCVDEDSKKDHLVFNRTVTLKEDSGK